MLPGFVLIRDDLFVWPTRYQGFFSVQLKEGCRATLCTGFYFQVVGLKHLASRDLTVNLHPGPDSYVVAWSPILRFGISASLWMAVAIVQVNDCLAGHGHIQRGTKFTHLSWDRALIGLGQGTASLERMWDVGRGKR